MSINEGDFILYLISGGFTLLIGIVILMGYMSYRKNSSKVAYEEQLEDLLTDENDPDYSPTITLGMRWNSYWAKLAKDSGMLRYRDLENNAGRDIAVLAVTAGIALSVIFKNPLAGMGSVAALVFLASMILRTLSNRKEEAINMQLPGFLFAFKANVQGNATPERAILKVIDSMPSPLYEEIVLIKHRLAANATFKDALEELSYRTSSRDLRFLCSCMIQAAGAGANLEGQIDTIQKVLEERQKVTDEITKAVKSTTPTIVVASMAIPLLFIGAYLIDPNAKAYWFIDPMSWAFLVAVVAFWLGGIFLSKKQADKIKKL